MNKEVTIKNAQIVEILSEEDSNAVSMIITLERRRFESRKNFQCRIFHEHNRLSVDNIRYWSIGWLDANCDSYGFKVMFFAGHHAYYFFRRRNLY